MGVHALMLQVRSYLHLFPSIRFLITIPEVAFVGKAPGTYAMLLGGGYHGQRLNKIYRGTALPYFYLP